MTQVHGARVALTPLPLMLRGVGAFRACIGLVLGVLAGVDARRLRSTSWLRGYCFVLGLDPHVLAGACSC